VATVLGITDGNKPPTGARVVCAMSGGVDSSVCAALLVEEGYEVIGVTMQLYDHGEAISRPGSCCAGRDIADAGRVADAIGIPHYVLNFEKRFREAVIDDFADAYLAGETPNPCIRCNQTVKFIDLLGKADELGAAALVTGHYARLVNGSELHAGADVARDQSYFLFTVTRGQMRKLHFPLGAMSKDETRALARRFALPVAAKPDSQDICFVPEGAYAEVLEKLRPGASGPGPIIDQKGAVIGRHRGIINYTIGQRRGLGIAGKRPLYVVRLDPETATVVVGPKEALLLDRLTIRDLNWLGDGDPPMDPVKVTVKLRSTTPAAAAVVRSLGNGKAEVVLGESQPGVAPGQACVIYSGARVLGGGWIRREETAG